MNILHRAPLASGQSASFLAIGFLIIFLSHPAVAYDSSCRSQSDTRLALVIGNSYAGTLDVSGAKDAEVMADHLCQLGFALAKPLIDAKLAEMQAAVDQFRLDIEKAKGVRDVVFFYSGHGYQIGGRNFLLPVGEDIDPDSPQLPLDDIVWALNGAPLEANKLVFLDACRSTANLKIKGGGTLKGVKKWQNGLSKIETPPSNTMFSFAAGYDRAALSGKRGEHSPYSKALLQSIREPGLELRNLLIRVKQTLKDIQVPATEGLPNTGPAFYFKEAIPIEIKVAQADDELIIIHNGEVAYAAQSQHADDPPVHNDQDLRLHGGSNKLALFVSNGRSYKSGQSWRVPEGWNYDVTLSWPEKNPVIGCSENCQELHLSGGEEIPFKDGPHHGRVFQVASAEIIVDPETWELEVNVEPNLWEKDAAIKAKSPDLLWESSIDDLRIEESDKLSNYVNFISLFKGLLAALNLKNDIKLPDTGKIFTQVHGNKAFERPAEYCMDDLHSERIHDLEISVSSALKNTEIKPFDSFDKSLSACVWDQVSKQVGNTYKVTDVVVWTALADKS